jgi:hypothetical protein
MTPGTLVEIMEAGSWNGPHTVTAQTGRTPDHLVLINNSNGVFFEHYADAPFNIRPVHTCTSQCDRCHSLENCVPATARRGELLLCDSCASLRDLHMDVLDALEVP